MKNGKWIHFVIMIGFIISAFTGKIASASISQSEISELLEMYVPVLYFHPEEIFRPQPVEVLVNESRLRKNRNNWFDENILNSVSLADLLDLRDEDFFLDVWYGAAGESDFKNYSAHRAYYQNNLSPDVGGPPISVYARYVDDQARQKIVLQYWLFYFYNDWFNKHEGDWELVQVVLDYDQNPEWVILSQHHGGTKRTWETTLVEDGTHPKVYVALGSHANYFWGNEIYPNGIDIGNTRVEIVDKTGSVDRTLPQVLLIPESIGYQSSNGDASWLNFLGSWGEQAFQKDFSGPTGPIKKDEQWDNAYVWGISQPLDIDVWYKNRLKVRVNEEAEISVAPLSNQVFPESVVDKGDGFFILHAEPINDAQWIFDISSNLSSLLSVDFSWPILEEEVVRHFIFADTHIEEKSKINLIMTGNGDPELQIGDAKGLRPEIVETHEISWESPDLVWIAGYLSAKEVVVGVIASFVAGVLPCFLYIVLIYNFDKNEKEPKTLIAAALLWGAIPAVLAAVFVNLFFQIPPDLLGPNAVEAIRAGIFSPLIEEALKGAVVVVIALRYKKEFNNLLDGIIYGAIVGLGFAMTGNTISYLGTFLFRGFSSLQLTIFVKGILLGLNHAFYTSIFGAGLGYSLRLRKRYARVLISLAGFLIAVVMNGFHSYITEVWVGITPLVVILNWLGIGLMIGIMILSARHEEKVLQEYLKGVLPEDFYTIISEKKKRDAYFKTIKKNFDKNILRTTYENFQLATKLAFLIYQSGYWQDADLEKEIRRIKEKLKNMQVPMIDIELD